MKLVNLVKISVCFFTLSSLYAKTNEPSYRCKGISVEKLWDSFLGTIAKKDNECSEFDFYDSVADLKFFIRKQRIDYAVLIVNKTQEDIEIFVEFIDSEKKCSSEPLMVKYNSSITVQKSGSTLGGVMLPHSPYFCNPKWSSSGLLEIHIETSQDKYFLHQSQNFNFEAKPFTQEDLDNPLACHNRSPVRRFSLSDLEQPDEMTKWMIQFNDNLRFVEDTLGKPFRLSLKDIQNHRRQLYINHNISHLLELDPLALDRAHNRIPLITHRIWLTNDVTPQSLPEHNFAYLENSILPNPTNGGWKHILWIESKEKLPELTKRLINHSSITLKEIKDLEDNFISGDLYKKALSAGHFGKATDILRLEILNKFGGYYMDTDYEVFQSLKPFSKVYDLVAAIEPMSAFLCNAFIGARPNHPVIHKYLDLIISNLRYAEKNSGENGYKTIVETGPAVFTLAFSLAAGHIGNIDIALPHMVIFPSIFRAYPCKPVVVPHSSVPAEAIGVHYWETSWLNKDLGSSG